MNIDRTTANRVAIGAGVAIALGVAAGAVTRFDSGSHKAVVKAEEAGPGPTLKVQVAPPKMAALPPVKPLPPGQKIPTLDAGPATAIPVSASAPVNAAAPALAVAAVRQKAVAVATAPPPVQIAQTPPQWAPARYRFRPAAPQVADEEADGPGWAPPPARWRDAPPARPTWRDEGDDEDAPPPPPRRWRGPPPDEAPDAGPPPGPGLSR